MNDMEDCRKGKKGFVTAAAKCYVLKNGIHVIWSIFMFLFLLLSWVSDLGPWNLSGRTIAAILHHWWICFEHIKCCAMLKYPEKSGHRNSNWAPKIKQGYFWPCCLPALDPYSTDGEMNISSFYKKLPCSVTYYSYHGNECQKKSLWS